MQTPPQPGNPPRFYQLILQEDLLNGWSLVRQYGTTGMAGTQKRQHYASLREAQSALSSCREQQLNRGFRITFIEGQNQ